MISGQGRPRIVGCSPGFADASVRTSHSLVGRVPWMTPSSCTCSCARRPCRVRRYPAPAAGCPSGASDMPSSPPLANRCPPPGLVLAGLAPRLLSCRSPPPASTAPSSPAGTPSSSRCCHACSPGSSPRAAPALRTLDLIRLCRAPC